MGDEWEKYPLVTHRCFFDERPLPHDASKFAVGGRRLHTLLKLETGKAE
jgi:hypothetical protein